MKIKSLLSLNFPAYTRLLELHAWLQSLSAGAVVRVESYAELLEICTKTASRDLAEAAQRGFPLVKKKGLWHKAETGFAEVFPLIRLTKDQIEAMDAAADRLEDPELARALQHLSNIFQDMNDQVSPSSEKMKPMARLACIDEQLSLDCEAMTPALLAGTFHGGDQRKMRRDINGYFEMLGADIKVDPEDGTCHHDAPFYFGAAVLQPAMVEAVTEAAKTATDKEETANLEWIKAALDSAISTVLYNDCYFPVAVQSAHIRKCMDAHTIRQWGYNQEFYQGEEELDHAA